MKPKKHLTYMEKRSQAEHSPEKRAKIFKMLCQHVRNGFSLDSFEELSDSSIKRFLSQYPEEFIEEELEDAKRAGKCMWEGIGKRQSTGECMGNSRSWYYNMSNRYGWSDKVDVEAEHKGHVAVQVVNYGSKDILQDS